MKSKSLIALLGSLASIAAFFGANAVAESVRVQQNINAPHSQNINVEGNATITHTINNKSSDRKVVFTDASPLISEPDIFSKKASDCVPLKGDSVNERDKAEAFKQPEFLTQVEVTSGRCAGLVGWVVTSKIERL
ncbi:MAG: hypothetical protein COB04_19295 [Gammaproteobacteria bacterium]|nr:MAG: hypothetical protein COB04_19295 [Gammaproteobacteria bacterium]